MNNTVTFRPLGFLANSTTRAGTGTIHCNNKLQIKYQNISNWPWLHFPLGMKRMLQCLFWEASTHVSCRHIYIYITFCNFQALIVKQRKYVLWSNKAVPCFDMRLGRVVQPFKFHRTGLLEHYYLFVSTRFLSCLYPSSLALHSSALLVGSNTCTR